MCHLHETSGALAGDDSSPIDPRFFITGDGIIIVQAATGSSRWASIKPMPFPSPKRWSDDPAASEAGMHSGATNELIQELSLRERKIFLTDLVRVEIDRFEVLSASKNALPTVYFPVGAVISCICVSGSSAVEVRGVGSEGMLGAQALHATEHPRFERVCQIGGEMLSMPGHTFVEHLASTEGLRGIIARYSISVMTLMAQSVACNGLHTIAQRCARWLLVTSDRVGQTEYPLTHELLAQMLGVHRPGISLAVNRLQRVGIIRYVRGKVSILDKGRLEAESCECYRIVVREGARINRGRKRRRP